MHSTNGGSPLAHDILSTRCWGNLASKVRFSSACHTAWPAGAKLGKLTCAHAQHRMCTVSVTPGQNCISRGLFDTRVFTPPLREVVLQSNVTRCGVVASSRFVLHTVHTKVAVVVKRKSFENSEGALMVSHFGLSAWSACTKSVAQHRESNTSNTSFIRVVRSDTMES
jgi:hypothetical protein